MKTIFNWILWTLLTTCLLHGQNSERPQVGFVRIVNAVAAGTGKATFHVNGRNLYADGYDLGQTTGGYGVKAGNLEIEVRKEGVESGSTRVNLGNEETITIIAFAEPIPAEKPEDPPKWVIRLLRLKQRQVESGYGVSMVSVCNTPESIIEIGVEGEEKAQRQIVKRLKVSSISLGGNRGEIAIRQENEVIGNISPDSPGNYVVILYQTPEGKTRALTFYDPKFVIAG
ncbi:MAG: hypothetical protein ACO3RV_05680 [Luteolibacter sp.]